MFCRFLAFFTQLFPIFNSFYGLLCCAFPVETAPNHRVVTTSPKSEASKSAPTTVRRRASGGPLIAILTGLGIGLGAMFATAPATAQQSERFDQYELHRSVVYTTFLSAEIAARYGISRGDDKAILTLSVRDADAGETSGRPMAISGRTWDLIHGGDLELKEIREGRATYYIAAFEFLDREWRFFEFDFTPEGSEQSYHYQFKVQLWKQED